MVSMIRNDNPDKGTETFSTSFIVATLPNMIRNDNPDKGTETTSLHFRLLSYVRLEMITPIRGRKQWQPSHPCCAACRD